VSIDATGVQGEILMNRFLYSPTCFSYVNTQISRSFPGIIDINKFNTETLDTCVYFGEANEYAAAHFTLHYLDTEEESETIYNRRAYEEWKPRVNAAGLAV